MSQQFKLKNIDGTRKYLLEEIKQNELMSRKHKNVYTTLIYIENFLILASAIDIPIGIKSFAIGLKTCVIAAEIKKYKSMIKKHDK